MDGLVWASIGAASPLYEMYWRPEKLLPLRYQAGWARTTSAPMLPGLLKAATVWAGVAPPPGAEEGRGAAWARGREARGPRAPHSRAPAPPLGNRRRAPAAGTSAASTEL